jgi:iron-chelate-transporting ATPase
VTATGHILTTRSGNTVAGSTLSERVESDLFELDGVGFSASGRQIVQPLNLHLAPGRMYGLVGPNGSGKSTLVKMLARQQTPSAGSIRLLGEAITDYGDREFARMVAYMPQFTPPAEGMSVRELVALGRFPWHVALGRFGAEDAARVESAIEQTDLRALSDRMVDSLSGGERQRAWLAMMVAQDTKCLLLDEPTSALDIAHQVEMLALVRKLSAERGVGVIIVIHDINMAARFCDDIVALRDGAIVAHGAPGVILASDVLQRIYGLPMGILKTSGMPVSYVL